MGSGYKLSNNIKEIKRRRLPVEVKNIVNILENLEEVMSFYFPNSIFYKYNNEVIIEKELLNKKLYLNYDFFSNIFSKCNDLSKDKKMENIEILINEKVDIIDYDISFTLRAYRIFWDIV